MSICDFAFCLCGVMASCRNVRTYLYVKNLTGLLKMNRFYKATCVKLNNFSALDVVGYWVELILLTCELVIHIMLQRIVLAKHLQNNTTKSNQMG